MAKKKIFVSFDYDNDRRYKNLLEAWDKNLNLDFAFSDQSSKEIKTEDISRVKAALTTKISNSTYTLVIVGKMSNSQHPDHKEIGNRNWQNWEIAKSKELGKKLVGVKIGQLFSSPDELLGAKASWAYSYDQKEIIEAINEA